MKIIERVVEATYEPNKNDLWLKPGENGSATLNRYVSGEWLPVGGSGGSGGGCDCPYKAGTPLLIKSDLVSMEDPVVGLTKSELAAAVGITEQDVDSIFELVRPSVGVYNPSHNGYNIISLSGYKVVEDDNSKSVLYEHEHSGYMIMFGYQAGTYGFIVSYPQL